jgi:hypothetical protein
MVTKLYKVYPAREYDSLDKSKFTSNIRWNVANTEFIVEFLTRPHANTITLEHEEAVALVSTPEWQLEIEL